MFSSEAVSVSGAFFLDRRTTLSRSTRRCLPCLRNPPGSMSALLSLGPRRLTRWIGINVTSNATQATETEREKTFWLSVMHK